MERLLTHTSMGGHYDAYSSTPQQGSDNDKLLVYLSYFGGLFFSWLIPLILWVLAPVNSWQKENQRESLNFQLTLFIYYFLAGVLTIVLIGYLILPVIWFWSLYVAIKATITVSQGKVYQVPGKINFLR